MRYVNPVTGKHPFPTITAFMQLLPDGFEGKQYRSTDGSVYTVIEGAGSAIGDGFEFVFAPGDVFVIPSWTRFRLNATSDAILFSFSDRAVQETLGFWREEAG